MNFNVSGTLDYYCEDSNTEYEVEFSATGYHQEPDHSSWDSDLDYHGFTEIDSVSINVYVNGNEVKDQVMIGEILSSVELEEAIYERLSDTKYDY